MILSIFAVGCDSAMLGCSDCVPIKELVQNGDLYSGQTVKVTGMYNYIRLEDSDGYLIKIDDNCKEKGRAYGVGETYTAIGKFTGSKIVCSQPLL